VKEAGYIFVYLSYEDQSNNYVYFDDFKITHTKSNLIQGSEYYPFGMQTGNSWTREAVTGNNYLANGGTELNATTQLYDLHYRNYDAALGRMFQLDPMASKYGGLTPYNYSLNNPTNLNDPLGDDVEPQPPYPREYLCAMCWREGENLTNYMKVSGGGMYGGWSGGGFSGGGGPMGAYWHPGDGRFFWSGYESGARDYRHDQDRVKHGDMSQYEFYKKYPGYTTYGGGPQALISVLNDFGYRFVKTPSLRGPSSGGLTANAIAALKSNSLIKASIQLASLNGTGDLGPQQTQSDPTLDAFRRKYFGGINGLANIYGSAPSGYDLVNGAFVKQGDPDKKPVSGVTNYLGNGKSDVYISPNSMTTNRELFLVMGHEFVHVYHYTVFGTNFNLAFSENSAYQWSIDSSVVNGWSYYEGIYSNIQKNDWPSSNASYNYLLSGINLVYPK
jgi:RHS repeat-associated protein